MAERPRDDLVARQRALRALADRHPDEFERLLDAERLKVGLGPRVERDRLNAEVVADLYGANMTIREIADHVGFSREAVRQALLRADVRLRSTGPRPVALSA